MTTIDSQNYQFIAWRPNGAILCDHVCQGTTLSISSNHGADIYLPEPLGLTAFLTFNNQIGTLIFEEPHGQSRSFDLTLGKPKFIGDCYWLLIKTNAEHTQPDTHIADGVSIFSILTKLSRKRENVDHVHRFLDEYLNTLVKYTAASTGMLILAEKSGYSMVATCGMSAEEGQKLWEKMPHNLAQDILRTGARILLPETLRDRSHEDTTVFISGLKSVAGFPIQTEGRLLGVLYLGFANLLTQMSDQLQGDLEAAADLLGFVIQRALIRQEVNKLKLTALGTEEQKRLPTNRLMAGDSQQIHDVYRLIGRLAPVDVPTLINGETGTGKELAAKEIHRLSGRANQPFIVVNAAALPESLVESELFGHRKGAFTGALADRVGLVELAAAGSLFIDEIGELSPSVQSKLLRTLQDKSVSRVGETTSRPVDFRLIAATHRNLEDMVREGRFRQDLYYRIAGATIHIPPLRERSSDVLTLANHFKARFRKKHHLEDKDWSTESAKALKAYHWPGNIRQLENIVGRAFVMAEGNVIKRQDLGAEFQEAHSAAGCSVPSPNEKLNAARDAWMKTYITDALNRHNGRRAETAKALGIGERTLFRYIEQFQIR